MPHLPNVYKRGCVGLTDYFLYCKQFVNTTSFVTFFSFLRVYTVNGHKERGLVKMKKIVYSLLCLLIILSLCAAFYSCDRAHGAETTGDETQIFAEDRTQPETDTAESEAAEPGMTAPEASDGSVVKDGVLLSVPVWFTGAYSIPAGCVSVDPAAFDYSGRITAIRVPASLKDASGLSGVSKKYDGIRYTADENSESYYASSGALYEKGDSGKLTLLYYPNGENEVLELPEHAVIPYSGTAVPLYVKAFYQTSNDFIYSGVMYDETFERALAYAVYQTEDLRFSYDYTGEKDNASLLLAYMPYVKEIMIPENFVGGNLSGRVPLSGFESLESVSVSTFNKYWFEYDGALYRRGISGGEVEYDCLCGIPRAKTGVLTISKLAEGVLPGVYAGAGVQSYAVQDVNTAFYADDGSLFLKDEEGVTLVFANPYYGGDFTVPEGTTRIGTRAFSNSDRAFTVILPSTYDNCPENDSAAGLKSAPNLSYIKVSDDNPYYAARRGVMYSKDYSDVIYNPTRQQAQTYTFTSDGSLVCGDGTLIAVPKGFSGDYAIPEGCLSVDETAFDCAGVITSIHIPASLTDASGLLKISESSKNLTFTSDGDNKLFKAYKGALYSMNIVYAPLAATLLYYPHGEGVTLELQQGAYLPDEPSVLELFVAKIVTNDRYIEYSGVLYDKNYTRALAYPVYMTGTLSFPEKYTGEDDLYSALYWNMPRLTGITLHKNYHAVYSSKNCPLYRMYSLLDVQVEEGNEDWFGYKGVLYLKETREGQTDLFLMGIPYAKSGVLTIHKNTADMCSTKNCGLKLTGYEVEEGNENFKVIDGSLFHVGYGVLRLRLVAPGASGILNVPEGVVSIDWIPDTITKVILPSAFYVSEDEPYMALYWLNTCIGVSHVEVSEDNPYCASKDGALYSKDFTELYWEYNQITEKR